MGEPNERLDPVAPHEPGAEDLGGVEPPSREERTALELAGDFAELARVLQEQPTTALTLRRIVEYAVEVVDGCEHAGITVVRGGRPSTVASTSALVLDVDSLQYEAREGPCLDALIDHAIYRTGDLVGETRWPAFAPGAVRLGVRSMLSFRLFTPERTLGGLNLYSSATEAFTDSSFAAGVVLAVHAGTAFAHARQAEQAEHLKLALHSNRAIGTAVGVVMMAEGLDQDAALARLTDESSRRNLKLALLADEVVRGRGLPARG